MAMNSLEKRAVFSLSSIMGLRMIGLFMVLPVFTLYASTLTGATPTLMGIAMGIYGLAQAVFQIPFGVLSDKFTRKPVILVGLLIFILGSVLAAYSHSIYMMMMARTLQGAGAVGSTILALLADLTREEVRTKSMAITGMMIGLSFAIAMILGPLLTQWMPISDLFLLSAAFGVLAIIILGTLAPTPTSEHWHADTEPELKSFFSLLVAPKLATLNIGIFILHAIFTASFIVIPIHLLHYLDIPSSHQWHIYLPTLLIGFLISLICIGIAESKKLIKPFFLGGIATLFIAETVMLFAHSHLGLMVLGIALFLTGFSLLEAFLPSLISRTAPKSRKGSAMGIFSCAQFSGIFVGGVLGGWIYGNLGLMSVYLFSMILALFWLILDFNRKQEPLQSTSSNH